MTSFNFDKTPPMTPEKKAFAAMAFLNPDDMVKRDEKGVPTKFNVTGTQTGRSGPHAGNIEVIEPYVGGAPRCPLPTLRNSYNMRCLQLALLKEVAEEYEKEPSAGHEPQVNAMLKWLEKKVSDFEETQP